MKNEAFDEQRSEKKEIHDGWVEAGVTPATVACDEMEGDISQTGNQTG